MSMNRALEASGLSVSFDSRRVLHDIDLAVDPGDFVVLLGGNGSGKTTLVRALLGLVPRQEGSVTLLGTPIERFREWKRIGYVPQRLALPTSMPATVGEVVLSGRISRAGLLRPYSKVDREAAHQALEMADLSDLSEKRVSRLSGGQQQRVLIARALATEPELILLDEPVSHVDVRHQVQFANLLRDAHSRGATVVLVAHALGAMSGLATRAVVLDTGHVSYDGPPEGAEFDEHDVHHQEADASQPLRSIGEER
jgi:zinc transport system ATP-binding protein